MDVPSGRRSSGGDPALLGTTDSMHIDSGGKTPQSVRWCRGSTVDWGSTEHRRGVIAGILHCPYTRNVACCHARCCQLTSKALLVLLKPLPPTARRARHFHAYCQALLMERRSKALERTVDALLTERHGDPLPVGPDAVDQRTATEPYVHRASRCPSKGCRGTVAFSRNVWDQLKSLTAGRCALEKDLGRGGQSGSNARFRKGRSPTRHSLSPPPKLLKELIDHRLDGE